MRHHCPSIPALLATIVGLGLALPSAAQTPKILGVGVNDGSGSAASYTSWSALGVNGSATEYTTTIGGNTIDDGSGGTITFSYDLTITAVGTSNNLTLEGGNSLLGDGGNFGSGEGFRLTVSNLVDDNGGLDVRFDGYTRFSTGNTGGGENVTVNGIGYTGAPNNLAGAPANSFSLASGGTVTGRYVDLQFRVDLPDVTPPAAPANLSVSVGSSQLRLDWDSNTESDFASYNVYRTSGGGAFAEIARINDIATSDYTDTGLTNGTAYTYKVTAFDTTGNESADSNEVTETPVLDTAPPTAVTLSLVSSANGQVSLDWTDSVDDSGIAQYIIYRKTDASEFLRIATRTISDYANAGLVAHIPYTYMIVAEDQVGNLSPDSNAVTTTPVVPTATPVKNNTQDQVDPIEVIGYAALDDATGTHFEDVIGSAHFAALPADFTADSDLDGESDLLEYKTGSDLDDSGARSVLSIDVVGAAAPTFDFYQRLSSASAYATVFWSTDLQTWRQTDVTELGRAAQPDGVTEKITCRLDDTSLLTAGKVFVRLEVGNEDYVADFVQPPAARHGTAVSMTARKAAFDPRTVEYYFECASGGGNDSGWQRARMYIDSGIRTGDNAITPDTTYTYRVKTRRLAAPAVAGDLGTPIPDSESEWSREVAVTTPVAAAKRPNVIVFMVDDLGWEAFDTYGDSQHNTPEISRMANEGIRLTHFYSQPLCTPSRVQIMSGRYAQRNYTGFDDYRQNTSFGNFFQNAGYQTAIAGKWQLDGNSLNGISRKDPRVPHWVGFDEYLLWHFGMANGGGGLGDRYWNPLLHLSLNHAEPGKSNYLDAAAMSRTNATIPAGNTLLSTEQWEGGDPYNGTVDADEGAAIDGTDYGPDLVNNFINDFATEAIDAGDNFFIYCPMILPHNPWPDPPTINPNDPKGTRHTGGNARYTMTEYMDYLVGRTLGMLRSHPDPNVRENTLVIFTADNGTNTGITTQFNGASYKGAKRETRDGGNHVPCIVWWGGAGGRIPTGRICHDVIDISDILATICDGAGVPIWRPAGVAGEEYIYDSHSFLSALFGKNRDPRRWSFGRWEGKNNDNSTPIRWVRNTRYKLYQTGGKNDGGSPDSVNRSGKFFDFINTPLERVPGGTYSVDDSLPAPAAGSRLEALKNEFQAVLDLHDIDIRYDTD